MEVKDGAVEEITKQLENINEDMEHALKRLGWDNCIYNMKQKVLNLMTYVDSITVENK